MNYQDVFRLLGCERNGKEWRAFLRKYAFAAQVEPRNSSLLIPNYGLIFEVKDQRFERIDIVGQEKLVFDINIHPYQGSLPFSATFNDTVDVLKQKAGSPPVMNERRRTFITETESEMAEWIAYFIDEFDVRFWFQPLGARLASIIVKAQTPALTQMITEQIRDLDQEIDFYQRKERDNPSSQTSLDLADCYYRKKDFIAAERCYEQAITAVDSKERVRAKFEFAEFLYDRLRFEEALNQLSDSWKLIQSLDKDDELLPKCKNAIYKICELLHKTKEETDLFLKGGCE